MPACSGRPVHSEDGAAATVPAPARQPSGVPEKSAVVANPKVSKENAGASAEYHFTLAQAYVAEGNPDRAIEEYKLTLMFDPNSSLVYARLAAEYVKKGMLTEAMETCKEALQRDSHSRQSIDVRLMLAGLYSASHETEEAIQEYDAVLKTDPKNEEATVYKAQTLIEGGSNSAALQLLHRFIHSNPDSATVWYQLGRFEQQLGHFNDSVRAYKKAIDLRPGFSQAVLSLGYAYEEKGMNAQAIKVYTQVYEDYQDLLAANRLATLYLKQEKYTQAIPYLEAIQAADPEDMNVRVKLGLIRMEMKEYDQAVVLFKEILTKHPDADRIHYYLASVYEETKQYKDAITELKLIKPDSKLFTDSTLHVGYLLKQNNEVQEAKDYIRDAIKQSPNTSSLYIFQANLEEESKNNQEAIVILETAAHKFPEDEKIRYYLGSLYDRVGDIDKGLAQMEEILKLNPENVDALNYIGYTWTQKGIRLNDAEKLLRRALGLKPENGYIQDSWGWYLFVRGRVREAVVQLEKAVRLKPNESTILEHLGDAYLRSNLREKAMMRYEDAVKYADDESSKQKVQLKLDHLKHELAGQGPSPNDEPTQRIPASDGSK